MIVPAVGGAAAFVLSMPFRLVPRHSRYRALLATGRRLTPLVGPVLLRRRGGISSGALDETTRVVFRAAVRARQRFDVDLDFDADADAIAAAAAGGAIFVTGRFPLNALFTRWLYDRRKRVATLRTHPRATLIWGTHASVEVLIATPAVMVRIRGLVNEECPVVMAVDYPRRETDSIAVETKFGTANIATPIFSFARRLDLPIFFVGVRATATRVPIATLRRISADPLEFAEQFRRHAGLMLP